MNENDLVRVTAEMVKAQASSSTMSGNELADSVKKVFRALRWVQSQEEKAAKAAEEPAMSGLDSIQRTKVICLECGKTFKQLSGKHLALHSLTPKEYKQKHGIPLRQSLSSRSLSAKRRKIAKAIGLGEKLAKARTKKKR